MAIQFGKPVVYGVKPKRPISNLPPDALKVRVRLRGGAYGVAFIKYADRIEQWILGFKDDNPSQDWALLFQTGVNA